MLNRIPCPSFVRPPAPLALAVALALTVAVTPASAALGRPADGGAGLVPSTALVNAALSVPMQGSQAHIAARPASASQAQPAQATQSPAASTAQPQSTQAMGAQAETPNLREAASRDSEIIKNLVYDADGRQGPGQRQPYELSLLEAVELALRNNLQVQVQRYGPRNSFEGINASRASFDPQLQFSIPSQYSRGSSTTTNQTAGGDIITQQNLSGGFSWSENLEWGTNYGLSWNSSRGSTNSEFSTFNPSFGANLRGNISQPLLQGFGDVNRTGIRISMNSYDQSLENFRGQVEGIIAQVVQAYWNVAGQAAALRVQEQTLDLSRQQLERNRIQVEIGTLAPIEMVQAETAVAGDELGLIQSRNQLENAQDTLKRLINFDAIVDDPFAWDVVATEQPEETVPAIDAEQAVQIALENDPGLTSQRIQLRSAALSLDQAENNLLPNLSVNASFNLQGRGGTRIIRGALGGEETEIIETGFGTAISQIFSGDFNTWSVGASLSFPLHNYSAKANAARARISQQQTQTNYELQRQQVVYAVRNQVRQVENSVQQAQTATLRRELADRQLQAELRKFQVGTSTNFQVLQFQQQFNQAQLSELQVINNLQNDIVQLELLKGTLLQFFGVQLGDAGTGGGQRSAPLPAPTGGGR